MANNNVTILTKPYISKNTYTYNGTTQTVEIIGYDSNTMTVSGTQNAKAVGTYSVTFSLKDPDSYVWNDDTTNSYTVTWRIEKAVVSIPKLINGNFTFDGTVHSPEVSGYDSKTMSASGDVTATNAGNYCIIYTLKDPNSYIWEDDTTEKKTIYWSITGQETPVSPSPDTPTPRAVSFEQLGFVKNYIDNKTELDYATTEEVKALFDM